MANFDDLAGLIAIDNLENQINLQPHTNIQCFSNV